MSIPLSIFLYIYYAFLAVWTVFSLVSLYHMFKFGVKSFTSFFAAFSYLAVSFVILVITYNYCRQIDWTSAIAILPGWFEAKMPSIVN
jgi:hypothetical protein